MWSSLYCSANAIKNHVKLKCALLIGTADTAFLSIKKGEKFFYYLAGSFFFRTNYETVYITLTLDK